MVSKFIEFCEKEAERMNVDPDLIRAIQELEKYGREPPQYFSKGDIFTLKRHLKVYESLSVYGFNSSRYDLPIIFDLIVQVFDRPRFNRKSVSILKKGNSYFSCNFGNLHFKDLLNFTCPQSLDRYLKTWTSNSAKLVYPYEKFSSIEEIRSQVQFPPITDFVSTLKHDVDEEIYHSCKAEYERRRTLPSGHPQKWSSFEDYLKYYNLSDVLPASKALIQQFSTYEDQFGLCPNHFLGLPSFAKAAMFAMYKQDSPHIFTFPENSDATKIFREGIVGGLTNVYKRHVTLDETEPAALRAKYSKRGIKWGKISFYDINSMYPATYGGMFPTGCGFEWSIKYGDLLTKRLMTKEKVSIESLEWLDFMQQECFKDSMRKFLRFL